MRELKKIFVMHITEYIISQTDLSKKKTIHQENKERMSMGNFRKEKIKIASKYKMSNLLNYQEIQIISIQKKSLGLDNIKYNYNCCKN